MQEGQKSFWDAFSSWEEAERAWDEGALERQRTQILKACRSLENVPYIDPSMSDLSMRLKGLFWILRKDQSKALLKTILKHPFKHGMRYLWSLLAKKTFVQQEDLFLYNTKSLQSFQELLKSDKTILIVGFSYCQKPFECPCSRFSDRCIADPRSPICRQCLIGKAFNALPNPRTIPVIIPTINDIGRVVLDTIHKHPQKNICFVITSCQMALSMFADLGYMVNVRGIGFRLHGHFCNTFKAFQLSEGGIKPGRTELSASASARLFELLRLWRKGTSSP